MAELVSFEDAAKELNTSTEEVSRLVSSGKLQTAEEGGLLMVTRESLNAYKRQQELAPLELSEQEGGAEPVPTIALAPDEVSEEGEGEPPAGAAPAEPAGEKTESIFGDEGFELETFTEAPAEGAEEELAELEEAGEALAAEEVAQLGAAAPARMRGVAAPAETSTAVSAMLVVTFLLLLFAGLVIFNFSREAPQVILQPISDWLTNLAQ